MRFLGLPEHNLWLLLSPKLLELASCTFSSCTFPPAPSSSATLEFNIATAYTAERSRLDYRAVVVDGQLLPFLLKGAR